MEKSQRNKIIVLVVFVLLLAGSAYVMFTKMVKPSPYFQQENVDAE